MPGKLFPLGGPVSQEDIVDREEFLATLEMRLADGQNIMLAGPRRMGKTTIALEMMRRLKEKGFYFSFIDLFRISDKREMAIAMIDACLENRSGLKKTTKSLTDGLKKITGTAKLAVKIEDLEFTLGFPMENKSDEELLDYALKLPDLLSTRDKKQMIFIFDEFQDVIRIAGEDILKIMRSHFQNHQKVSYLFLGSKEGMMNTIFGSKNQAFYRFATILPLPDIAEEAWMMYIRKKYKERNMEINDDSLKHILMLTGGHPQDTMLVCSEIYYAMIEAEKVDLRLEFVRIGHERALMTLESVFDEIVDEIGKSTRARQVLHSIANGDRVYANHKGNPNETKRAIDVLIEKAIIIKSGRGSYQFNEPMFKEYVLRKF